MARTPERTRRSQREIDVTDEPRGAHARRDSATQPDLRRRGDTAVEREVHMAANGSAIAALVVGMFAATYAFFAVSALAAVIAGIVAVGLGMKGISRANRQGGLHKGLAVSGVVTGVLGLLLGIAVIAGSLTLFQNMDTSDLPASLQQPVEEIRNGG
jgi:phosphate/sulfate permease